MRRRRPSEAIWSLDGLLESTGPSLLDHVSALLGPAPGGPVPNGGEPLPDEGSREKDKLRFIAGGEDAVLALPDDAQATLAVSAALLDFVARPPTPQGLKTVCDRLADVRGPAEIDRLLSSIRAGRPSRERLATLARWVCREGTTRGVVKAGIALLGVSGNGDDKDLIVRLGLLEELTLYSLVALRNLLPEPENAVFELAQQVEGWGRVQAVRRLKEAKSPEVKHWLLYGGYANGVMYEYTAFIAATTGGLRSALESPEVDDELLDHAGAILDALAMGGPAEDLSDYEEAEPALVAYLNQTMAATPTVRRVRHLVSIRICLDNAGDEERPNLPPAAARHIVERIDELTGRPAWRQPIVDALESDDLRTVTSVIATARNLGFDPTPAIRKWIEVEPGNSFLWHHLTYKADVDAMRFAIAAAERLLPLEQLQSGPTADLGLGRDYEFDQALGYVLRGLRGSPGEGWQLIAIGLKNRVTRNRNSALRAIAARPRDSWPAEVEPLLNEALWREPEPKTRETIRALLQGEVTDGE